MKTIEQIKNQINHLEDEQQTNYDRKLHFENENYFRKVDMYNRMIEKTNSEIQALKWVLDEC